MTPLEIIAVVTAVLYLLLAIRQNIWCWVFGGISTAILTWLSLNAELYMQSALNATYFALSIYGWFSWRAGGADEGPLKVTRWPIRIHAIALPAIIVIAALNGYLLGTACQRLHCTPNLLQGRVLLGSGSFLLTDG